jgi:hypothetical protein
MNKYDRLILSRQLKSAIRRYEDSLKTMQPGTDYYEMVLGDIQEAQDTLARLEHGSPDGEGG